MGYATVKVLGSADLVAVRYHDEMAPTATALYLLNIAGRHAGSDQALARLVSSLTLSHPECRQIIEPLPS
jgi:hypothetical protein